MFFATTPAPRCPACNKRCRSEQLELETRYHCPNGSACPMHFFVDVPCSVQEMKRRVADSQAIDDQEGHSLRSRFGSEEAAAPRRSWSFPGAGFLSKLPGLSRIGGVNDQFAVSLQSKQEGRLRARAEGVVESLRKFEQARERPGSSDVPPSGF